MGTGNDQKSIIDLSKGLLILLVVFGHLIEPAIDERSAIKFAYMFVYGFHMPLFVFISGMLSKIAVSREDRTRLFENLFIPFIVMTIVYEVFEVILFGEPSHYTRKLKPYWILWYLYSLYLWRLALPHVGSIASKLRQYSSLIFFCMAVCLLGISSVGYTLGAAKTITFFPYFLLGHQYGKSAFAAVEKLTLPTQRILLFSALILYSVFITQMLQFSVAWLHGGWSYPKLGVGFLQGAGIRVLVYLSSIIGALLVLLVASNLFARTARYGKQSLYVFLWHGFIAKTAAHLGFMKVLAQHHTAAAFGASFVAAIVIVEILSVNAVEVLTKQYLFQPFVKLTAKISSGATNPSG